jgi:hypothetical protein
MLLYSKKNDGHEIATNNELLSSIDTVFLLLLDCAQALLQTPSL